MAPAPELPSRRNTPLLQPRPQAQPGVPGRVPPGPVGRRDEAPTLPEVPLLTSTGEAI